MFKQTLPLLVALAIGCSSSSQYERGAYTPPVRAPAFNPATDAPHTTGQPGYVNGQRVERSPNRRYVEPSREPQMMAADGDSARAVELIINELLPKSTPAGLEDEEYAACWKDFWTLAYSNKRVLMTFSPEEMRCLRHGFLWHCGSRKIEKRKGEDPDSKYENAMARKRVTKSACGVDDEHSTPRVVDWLNRMIDHGDSSAGFGWRP